MSFRRTYAAVLCVVAAGAVSMPAQNFRDEFEAFRQKATGEHSSFRDQCNARYADFLRGAWDTFTQQKPVAQPQRPAPVPAVPYDESRDTVDVVETQPVVLAPAAPEPQPLPAAPVPENPSAPADAREISFYGLSCPVRINAGAGPALASCSPKAIADAWSRMSGRGLDNTLRDCLAMRIEHGLCDWAYLGLLDRVGRVHCDDPNDATLLTAWLFCQSGYQMRLAVDGARRLVMLYGRRHLVYDTPFYEVNGLRFYPYGKCSGDLQVCDARFDGESPLSLMLTSEQRLGPELTDLREIASAKYPDIKAETRVPAALIDFFDSYPNSSYGGNELTRYAVCAETPLAEATRRLLYPVLRRAIEGCSEREAADRLLDFVQTGLTYRTDNSVWGHDRVFFAEETLYYPYCDCEDRSILFSRLVRDLLGLDTALVYYPGHLASAVAFGDDAEGDAMLIDGRRFIVCDPTYIGAPVGKQMPGLDYARAEAIVLK